SVAMRKSKTAGMIGFIPVI
ncbi:hypothetical protein AZ039_001804, partial [Enterobacter kobei]